MPEVSVEMVHDFASDDARVHCRSISSLTEKGNIHLQK
jgi:hypothetical protein